MNSERRRMMDQPRDADGEAKRYLDSAITRHREFGDDKKVPRAVYDRALSRTARTVKEFARLSQRRNAS
jgi:hypothetical protein